jgi:predicted MFS family arabinose efflux permease
MDGLNRPYRRDRVTGLAVIFNSTLTAFQVGLGAVMPIVRDNLGMSLSVASLHFTIMAVFGMLSSHLTATVSRALGRRRTILFSIGATGFGLLLFCAARNVEISLLAAVVIGSSGSFGVIVTQAEVFDHHRWHRATASAELTLTVSAAMFIMTIGAAPLVSWTGSWRLVLLMPALISLGSFVVIGPIQFSDHKRTRSGRSQGTMTPLAWLFCVLIIAQSAFEWCYGYLGAEFMNKAGGLSKSAAAAAMIFYYAGLVLGRMLLLQAVRRFTSLQLLLTSFATASIGFLLLAAAPTTLAKCSGLFCSGLGISLTFPMISSLAAASFPQATDWILSRIYTAGGLAVAVAPFVIGTLGDAVGIGTSFWVVGLIGALGLIATPLLIRVQVPGSFVDQDASAVP